MHQVADAQVQRPDRSPHRESEPGAFSILPQDVQKKVRVRRASNLVLFVVDASWSMAGAQRMEATKGAIMSLLQDAYQRRDEVGLVAFNRAEGRIEVIQHRQQVNFTQHHGIRGSEHHRVLGRLVVALGHRQQCHVGVVPEVETGRADQVADILDEQHAVVDMQPVEGLVDHFRVQVTAAPGDARLRAWSDGTLFEVGARAAVYGAASFAVLEASDILFPRIGLPDWTVTFVAVLALIGFPVALVVAWVYERTSAGLRRTAEAETGELEAIASAPAASRSATRARHGRRPRRLAGSPPWPEASWGWRWASPPPTRIRPS